MSHVYTITAGNPEGFDWVLDIEHDEGFSQERFKEIVEDVFIEVWDENIREDGYALQSSIDTDKLYARLARLGFRHACHATARYDFEPYWGDKDIGPKLKAKLAEMDALNNKRTSRR